MARKRVLIARPRLDCSFKRGPVPAIETPSTHPVRILWARFIDQLAEFHSQQGWYVGFIGGRIRIWCVVDRPKGRRCRSGPDQNKVARR